MNFQYQHPNGTFGPRLNPGCSWTDAMDASVIQLISDGHSAAKIAIAISEEFDIKISRNAVLGRIHRKKLGTLPKRNKYGEIIVPGVKRARAPTKRIRTWRPKPKAKPELAPVEVEVVIENLIPTTQRKTLLELNDTTCKWPVGDVGTPDFFFCGGNSLDGLPYCAYHSRVAYQAADRKKDRFGSREGKPSAISPAVTVPLRPRAA